MAGELTRDRLDAALLVAGRLAAFAEDLDLEAVEHLLAVNPGPQVYLDMLTATITFVKEMRRIQQQRGHERAACAAVAAVIVAGRPN